MKEILTEDILDLCKLYDNAAKEKVYSTIGMDMIFDYPFVLAEKVFWHFADDKEYENPMFDDIENVVKKDYLKRDY